MKQFSPAGMATKGFYGGAGWPQGGNAVNGGRGGFGGLKNFGNPDGATSGGGAWGAGGANPNGPNQGGGGGGPTSAWALVFGDNSGDAIADMAVADSTSVVAVTTGSNVIYSTDGGTTWVLVTAPMAGFDGSMATVATDGAVYCVVGIDSGSNTVVGRSTDGGATWAQVSMPGGFHGHFVVTFAAGHFVIFDTIAAELWASPDALTWTARALGQVFHETGWATFKDNFVVGGGRGVWVGRNTANTDGLTVTTTDGVTFTQTQVNVVKSFDTVSYDGQVFNAIGPQGGGPIYGVTSTDGATWTHVATGSGGPPFEADNTALPGVGILNGFSGLTAATSTDHGVTYNTVTPVTTLTSFGNVGNDATRAFILGDGIIATTDLVTFTTELSVPGGTVTSVAAGSGLTFAWGNNGVVPAIWKRAAVVSGGSFQFNTNSIPSSCPSDWMALPALPSGFNWGGVPCGAFNTTGFFPELNAFTPSLPIVNGHMVAVFSIVTADSMCVVMEGGLAQDAWTSMTVDAPWSQTYLSANALEFDNAYSGLTIWRFNNTLDPFSPFLFGHTYTVTFT